PGASPRAVPRGPGRARAPRPGRAGAADGGQPADLPPAHPVGRRVVPVLKPELARAQLEPLRSKKHAAARLARVRKLSKSLAAAGLGTLGLLPDGSRLYDWQERQRLETTSAAAPPPPPQGRAQGLAAPPPSPPTGRGAPRCSPPCSRPLPASSSWAGRRSAD